MKKYLALALSSVMLLSQAGGLSVHASTEELVYRPIALDYNVNVFSDTVPSTTVTNGGVFRSNAGIIYASKFMNNQGSEDSTKVTWKDQWVDNKNTFTYPGSDVEFEVQVDPTGEKPGAFISNSSNSTYTDTNNARWTTIDVDNMTYESIDFLARGTNQNGKWGSVGIKLTYTDGTTTVKEFSPMGDTTTNTSTSTSDGNAAPTDSEGHILLTAGKSSNNVITDEDVYIFHYSVEADQSKTLDKIDVLSYHMDLVFDGNEVTGVDKHTTAEGTGFQGGIIFAMTGVITQANWEAGYEEIRKNQPVSVPVDLSGYYNVTKIWGDGTETIGGYAAPDRGNLKAGVDDGSGIQRYWVAESGANAAAGWKEGTWTEEGMHTLTSQGVDFTLKVVSGDTENTAFFNRDYVSDTEATGEALWSTVELDDYKYTSIELLQACSATQEGDYSNQEIRLNYEDGTYQYYQQSEVKEAKQKDTNAENSVELQGYMVRNSSGENGASVSEATSAYMHHYTIAADPSKVLKSISVLSCNYDFATGFENGQTTEPTYTRLGLIKNADRSVPIYAITGMVTVAELEAAEARKPKSVPINLDDYYNIDTIYATSGTNGNACNDNGKFFNETNFKASTTAGWKTPWEDIRGDKNTLNHGGVDFELKVSTTGYTAVTAGKTINDNWRKIDMPDAKYTSIELLQANAFSNSDTWKNAEIRLEYAGENGTEYEYYGYDLPMAKGTGLGNAKTPITGGIDVPAGTSNTGKMWHFSIPANPNKTLQSISILGFRYDYSASPASKTQVGNSTINKYTFADDEDDTVLYAIDHNGTVTKGHNIYAITGMVTPEEYERLQEEERKNQPVSYPVDLTGHYNVANIYTASETYDNGDAYGGGSGGAYYCDDFKNAAYWKTPWSEGQTENTLTNEGIEFTLKVVNDITTKVAVINTEGKGTTVATDDAVLWKTIDLEDKKYKSVDMLMAFALDTADPWSNQEIRLNYAEGEHQYFKYTVPKPNVNIPADAVGAVILKGRFSGTDSDNGKMFHYSIPADTTKVLESISIMSYNHDYDGTFTQGQTTTPTVKCNGSTKDVVKAVNVYAITGVTTVGEVEANEPAFTIENAEKTYNDDANTITVTGTVKKISSKTSCAYLALYVDGRLQEVKDITSVTNLNCTFQNVSKDGEVKYFVWESVSNMKPYFAAVTVNEAL